MVKALLADRFKLSVRTETRELPILELRLARSDGQVGSNLHNCCRLERRLVDQLQCRIASPEHPVCPNWRLSRHAN